MSNCAYSRHFGQVPEEGFGCHLSDMSDKQPDKQVTCTDQRQGHLLLQRTVCDRSQDVRIKPRIACQLLGIHLIALAVTVRYHPQFTDVRYDNLVPKPLKLFADPDRMGTSVHGDPCWW